MFRPCLPYATQARPARSGLDSRNETRRLPADRGPGRRSRATVLLGAATIGAAGILALSRPCVGSRFAPSSLTALGPPAPVPPAQPPRCRLARSVRALNPTVGHGAAGH